MRCQFYDDGLCRADDDIRVGVPSFCGRFWEHGCECADQRLERDKLIGVTESEPKDDEKVQHPAHYQGEHECIEIMKHLFGVEAVKAFCRCNSFKYRFRAGKKEGASEEDDLKKAKWYEDYLIKMEEDK